MTDFVTVAIVLFLFLIFGIAMGVLMISMLSNRKAQRSLEDDERPPPPPELPEEDEKPPWYGR